MTQSHHITLIVPPPPPSSHGLPCPQPPGQQLPQRLALRRADGAPRRRLVQRPAHSRQHRQQPPRGGRTVQPTQQQRAALGQGGRATGSSRTSNTLVARANVGRILHACAGLLEGRCRKGHGSTGCTGCDQCSLVVKKNKGASTRLPSTLVGCTHMRGDGDGGGWLHPWLAVNLAPREGRRQGPKRPPNAGVKWRSPQHGTSNPPHNGPCVPSCTLSGMQRACGFLGHTLQPAGFRSFHQRHEIPIAMPTSRHRSPTCMGSGCRDVRVAERHRHTRVARARPTCRAARGGGGQGRVGRLPICRNKGWPLGPAECR